MNSPKRRISQTWMPAKLKIMEKVDGQIRAEVSYQAGAEAQFQISMQIVDNIENQLNYELSDEESQTGNNYWAPI